MTHLVVELLHELRAQRRSDRELLRAALDLLHERDAEIVRLKTQAAALREELRAATDRRNQHEDGESAASVPAA